MKQARRIAWYTRKVAAWGAVHPTKRDDRHGRRGKRLIEYKAALNKRLKGSGSK
ncbi:MULTISPECIES: hypothetical protein [Siminovitchia]|uniref:hypothetical protein n=1 Tax=Siminovitchia TaxID=2837510 RepID=UPI001642A085|nr:hypothetical protein [Siminovitchia fortis]